MMEVFLFRLRNGAAETEFLPKTRFLYAIRTWEGWNDAG